MKYSVTLFDDMVYFRVVREFIYKFRHMRIYTTFQRPVIRMDISIKPCILTFTFDKNTKVKSILPNGENEFTVVFEKQTECSPTPEIVEMPNKPAQINIIPKSKHLDETCCPTADDVVEYIRSHDLICDNTEIHMHFLGKILSPRGENSFYYYKTSDAIRKAKEKIKNEENGEWKKIGTNKKTRFEISTFVKNEPTISTEAAENTDNVNSVENCENDVKN